MKESAETFAPKEFHLPRKILWRGGMRGACRIVVVVVFIIYIARVNPNQGWRAYSLGLILTRDGELIRLVIPGQSSRRRVLFPFSVPERGREAPPRPRLGGC